MAIVYLTYDSEIELIPRDDVTKNFQGKLGPANRTTADYLLGKTGLKIYHNEFLNGGQFVDSSNGLKYVIKGTSKMTVKPKVAEELLSGPTQWVLTNVRVDHDDEADNRTVLAYAPSKEGLSVTVDATLDKPGK